MKIFDCQMAKISQSPQAKIYTIALVALIFLLLRLPVFAQFEEAFTEENFAKQPPLTEKDITAFIKSENVYRSLLKASESGSTPAETDSYVIRELGISVERYIFVAAKLAVCQTLMFDSRFSEAEQQTLFTNMPAYFSPNASEKALIKKYQTQIASMFAKINAE